MGHAWRVRCAAPAAVVAPVAAALWPCMALTCFEPYLAAPACKAPPPLLLG